MRSVSVTFAVTAALAGAVAAGGLGIWWLHEASCGPASALRPPWEDCAMGGYLLVVALAAGLIASGCILRGAPRLGATLLLVAGVAPGVFEPKAFVVTSVLVFAGLLAGGAAAPRMCSHPLGRRADLRPRRRAQLG